MRRPIGVVSFAAVLAVLAVPGCVSHTALRGGGGSGEGFKGAVFLEPSIDRASISVRRIAIVPNRLPNNLVEPERWRRSNFEIARRELQRNGFDVVDYESSVAAFERSGLPTEDTRASRDKYAELCQQLGVDAVFVPYYGTQSTAKGVFVINTFTYSSIVTFQVFLAERNDFLARIDATATKGYVSGIAAAIGIIVGSGLAIGAAGAGFSRSSSGQQAAQGLGLASSIVSVAMPIIDSIISGVLAAGAPEGYWDGAFDEAIRTGLRPFLAAIRPGGAGGGRAPAFAPQPAGPQPYGAPPYGQPAYQQPAPQQPRAPLGQPPYGAPPSAQPAYQPPYQQPAPQQPRAPQAPQPYPQQPPAQQPPPGYPQAPPRYAPPPGVPPGACSSNADCAAGRICVQAQCVALPEVPLTAPGCQTDNDCKAGRACVQGQCVAR